MYNKKNTKYPDWFYIRRPEDDVA